MQNLRYLIIIILIVLSIKNTEAQVYITDPAYVLDTLHSDEFDSNYLKSKWDASDNSYGMGIEYMYKSNVITQGDSLSLKVTNLSPLKYANGKVYSYSSAQIINWNQIKYGYIEMRAKYPVGKFQFWPCLWFWNQDCDSNDPNNTTTTFYNEIDAFEEYFLHSYNGQGAAVNNHCTDSARILALTSCPPTCTVVSCGAGCNFTACSPSLAEMKTGGQETDLNLSPASLAAYHKYGILWTPESLTFYFDDDIVKTYTTYVPNHPMTIFIDLYMNQFPTIWQLGYSGLPYLASPYYFTLDYFRYYKLNTDCNTDKVICTPSTDYSSRAVEKTITTGGSGCGGSPSVTFNTNDKFTLRATNSVTLDAGTTINGDGSGYFLISIESCPN